MTGTSRQFDRAFTAPGTPSGRTWFRMGYEADLAGDVERAILCYQTAVDLKPDHTTAWFNLGLLLKRQGRVRESQECFGAVLDCEPQHYKAMVMLANLHYQRGDFTCARSQLERALAHEPGYAKAWRNLAIVLGRLGMNEQSMEARTCYEMLKYGGLRLAKRERSTSSPESGPSESAKIDPGIQPKTRTPTEEFHTQPIDELCAALARS